MTLEKKSAFFFRGLIAVMILIIIYFYFLPWRTWTMYGDDLYIFKSQEGLKSFSGKIAMMVAFDKFRPVHGLSMQFLIELFHKHTGGYYLFNIGIQAINTFLFALIVNLFLRSYMLSLLAGLTVGLSRFAYFNITQLLNGGALEGLAMTFFLTALFFLIRSFIYSNYGVRRVQWDIFLSILFANAAMYTHERYIVLLPFILLLVLFYPGLKQLTTKQKISICMLALGSIFLNVVLKKVAYGMPFFVGTAGTTISFSFSAALAFFTDAVLSVLQFNKGPNFLVGVPFNDLPFFAQLLTSIFFTGIAAILVVFTRSTISAFLSGDKERINRFWLVVFLMGLFGLCLAPAVVTIRLEQRWLQAPYAILVLCFILAFSSFPFRNIAGRNLLVSLFITLLLWVDFNYLHLGANNLYITSSQKIATAFERAVNNGTIHPGTKNIYLWEKQRDANSERSINWVVADGYFFEFYQKHRKKLYYIDSKFFNTVAADTIWKAFNQSTDQVINPNNGITDMTDDYLQHSPKYFSRHQTIVAGDSSQYFPKQLLISAAGLDSFFVTGFYGNENTIRWTNGNATIGFSINNIIKDTLTVILNTYLPPVCKNVVPNITLQTITGTDCLPVVASRNGDRFTFKFYFPVLTIIQNVNILSGTIQSAPPDQRVLSFPFLSLEIKR